MSVKASTATDAARSVGGGAMNVRLENPPAWGSRSRPLRNFDEGEDGDFLRLFVLQDQKISATEAGNETLLGVGHDGRDLDEVDVQTERQPVRSERPMVGRLSRRLW
jgi:hypothetical protein